MEETHEYDSKQWLLDGLLHRIPQHLLQSCIIVWKYLKETESFYPEQCFKIRNNVLPSSECLHVTWVKNILNLLNEI